MTRPTHGLDRLIDNSQLDLDHALVRIMIGTVAPGLADLVEQGAATLAAEFGGHALARYAAGELIMHELAELLRMESGIDRAAVLRQAMLTPEYLADWYSCWSTIIENRL